MKTLAYLAWFAGALVLAVAQENKKTNVPAGSLAAADEAAIRAASKTYERAGNIRDWRTTVALFTDDIVFMPPNAPATTGRSAVGAMLDVYPRFKDLRLEPVDLQGRGDLAYIQGRYSLVFTPPNQPAQPDTGKYIEIWRKEAGAWKYARGIFNSDLPPPATAAAAATISSNDELSVVSTITAAANAALNSAEAGTEDWLAHFSSQRGEVRFLSEGVAPTLARFHADWVAGMKSLSRQVMSNRDIVVQVLSADAAVSFTTANYQAIGRDGAASATAPMAWSAVWKRSNGEWKIVHAHQSVQGDWPNPPSSSATAGDPWLGTWVLNLAKTRINPGPAPKGEIRTYTSTANGERATYDEIHADGKRVYSTSTYRFDGQDAKVVGDPDSNTQAITRTSPRSIASVIKKEGKVVRSATREVSADGKALTVEFKGTNAKGQPIIEEKWVFDRRDEPWLGAWELNAGKSRIAASAKPKFDFRTFAPTANGEHAVYVTIESDGKPTRSECNIVYDGTDQPVVAGEPGETLAFTRASARSLAFANKQNGKVVSTGTRAVSADGNVLTVTVKHAERGEEVWVLERRAADTTQDNVAAAIKAAVATHWHAINGGIGATVDNQHTSDISAILADLEPRLLVNSPVALAMRRRWEGAKPNWSLREVEVQPLGHSAAAASFYMDGSIRWADGTVDSRPRRVTEIWINDNGTWKEAHHHDSVYTANPKPAAAQ